MSNGNYSTSMIVTCRECGAFDCKIVKGLCNKHYKHQLYKDANADAIAQRAAIRVATQDPASKKARKAAYYQKNKERLKEMVLQRVDSINQRRRELNAAIPQEIRAAKQRANYKLYKQTHQIGCKRYALANKEKIAAAKRKYRESRLDEIRIDRQKKRAAGLMVEQDKARKAKRRARKLSAGGTHTASDIRQLKKLQKCKCAICQTGIQDGYHLDHIYPLALGGRNDKGNLQLLCQPCNQFKHAKDPIDHMQSLGFLL